MCGTFTTNTTKTYISGVCNTPGSHYSFQAKCQWKLNGVTRSQWVSSPWVKDRTRATVKCPIGKVVGVGYTVYYNGKNLPV